MTNFPDPSLSPLEAEGVPDLDDRIPSKVLAGDAEEGMPPPGDAPIASRRVLDYGAKEPLDVRLAAEEPEETLTDGIIEPPVPGTAPAEEAAMHVAGEDELA